MHYHSDAIYHPFAWRGWWDFGTGALGDIACHAMNMVFHAPGSAKPSVGPGRDFRPQPRQFPRLVDHHLRVRGYARRPALKLCWYDGGKRQGGTVRRLSGRGGGCLVIGDKGKMLSAGGEPEGFRLTRGLVPPPVQIPRVARPFRRVRPCHPRRVACLVEFPPIRRPAHRNGAGGQFGCLGGELARPGAESQVGRREPARDQPRRTGTADPEGISARLFAVIIDDPGGHHRQYAEQPAKIALSRLLA